MRYFRPLHQAAPAKSIAASAEDDTASVNVEDESTITVFVRITYSPSATAGAQVNVYPVWSDGSATHTCTEPLVQLAVPLDTSSAVVWASVPINVEDVGEVAVKVQNLDGTYAMTLNSIAVYGTWR